MPRILTVEYGRLSTAPMQVRSVTDISGAFLNAFLPPEDLFAVEIPPEFKDPNKDEVWMLSKALYGLRGAPKYWQEHLATFLLEHGLERLVVDSAVFVRRTHGEVDLVVVAHVDDL